MNIVVQLFEMMYSAPDGKLVKVARGAEYIVLIYWLARDRRETRPSRPLVQLTVACFSL